jgi:hypothetical protein
VATLHAGFQVGLNIHTAAYVLMLLVILSGVVGVVLYVRVPRLLTANRRGDTLEAMAREVVELDRQAAQLAVGLGDEIVAEVRRARDATRVGGGFWRRLSGRDRSCATAAAFARVAQLAQNERGAAVDGLLGTLKRKLEVLRRMRQDIRYKALLEVWLLFHVPLSFALLAALVAHIVAVFFYWG